MQRFSETKREKQQLFLCLTELLLEEKRIEETKKRRLQAVIYEKYRE